MSQSVVYGLKRIPQHFLTTRWFTGFRSNQSKNIHSSSVYHNLDPGKVAKLVTEQGRRSILKLKSKDSVPEHYELIYKAPMEFTFRISYSTAMLCGMGMIGALIYNEYNKENIVPSKSTVLDNSVKFINPKKEVWFFSSMLLLMIIAGSAIILKYPFRIYKHKNKKEYFGVFISPFLPYLRQVKFKSATQTQFKNPFYFLIRDCHYVIDGKRKIILMSQYFRVPKDLTDMYEDPKK